MSKIVTKYDMACDIVNLYEGNHDKETEQAIYEDAVFYCKQAEKQEDENIAILLKWEEKKEHSQSE